MKHTNRIKAYLGTIVFLFFFKFSCTFSDERPSSEFHHNLAACRPINNNSLFFFFASVFLPIVADFL